MNGSLDHINPTAREHELIRHYNRSLETLAIVANERDLSKARVVELEKLIKEAGEILAHHRRGVLSLDHREFNARRDAALAAIDKAIG